MARPRRIDPDLVAQAGKVATQTQDIQELRMAQSIMLPALAQMTLDQTAAMLGVGRATVARLQTRFRQQKGKARPPRPPWGGRRRALMSLANEQAFLDTWRDKAERGELVVLTPLMAALEQNLGRRVKPSVVYRLLERHRWRKVAPDTRHPKAEPSVQQEWKKKRYQKIWRPC
jgi:transposase